MRVLNADQMAAYERWAMDTVGLPEAVLMENAAQGVVRTVQEVLGERLVDSPRVLVLVGPGNNGGDGLAAARLLHERGVRVQWIRIGSEPPADSLSANQERSCRSLGLAPLALRPGTLREVLTHHMQSAELVLDALLGTGVSRPLAGDFRVAVEVLNGTSLPVVSVDLPTGLDASSHCRPDQCVKADVTVTFAAHKVPHVLSPARECCGEVSVVPLGAPIPQPSVGPGLDAGNSLHLFGAPEARELLQRRPRDSHKGTYGHVLVVGGSVGMSGAVVLAARAAVRSGAGLVTAAVPAAVRSEVEAASLESMTLLIPSFDDGDDASVAVRMVMDEAQRRDVVALGPGLGASEGAKVFLRRMLAVAKPLVVDADGLNALGEDLEVLVDRPAATVLTPHPGELGRLLGCSTAEIQADRVAAGRSAALRSRSVVVLKGHQTLTCTPSGDVWINTTGNPGMATGGSGDVLTGLLSGLLAQGLGASESARLAAFIHGASGDLASSEMGEAALAAGDLIEWMGRARQALGPESEGEASSVHVP